MRPPALEVFYRLWLLYLRVLNFISLRYQLDLLWASFFKKKKIVKRFVENYLPLGNSTLKHFPHESYIPLILIIFCFDGKRASFLHVEKVSCEEQHNLFAWRLISVIPSFEVLRITHLPTWFPEMHWKSS